MTWILFSMIMYYLFCSDIQSNLVNRKDTRIETFGQLIERKDILIYINRGSFPYTIVRNVSQLGLWIYLVHFNYYFQELSELKPRLIKINSEKEFSLDLAIDLMFKNMVLISSEYRINDLIKIFANFDLNLIQTGDISFTNLYGFPVRKDLDEQVKFKLAKMWVR